MNLALLVTVIKPETATSEPHNEKMRVVVEREFISIGIRTRKERSNQRKSR
jgi:hypothetical protein